MPRRSGVAGSLPCSLPEGVSPPLLGGVAEWLGSGLQSRVHRFNSGPRLLIRFSDPGA
jgi:hypothetical protein